jgi:hypothetical protein
LLRSAAAIREIAVAAVDAVGALPLHALVRAAAMTTVERPTHRSAVFFIFISSCAALTAPERP